MSQNKWVKFLMTLSNNLSRNAHGGCAMMMMIVPDCRPHAWYLSLYSRTWVRKIQVHSILMDRTQQFVPSFPGTWV
jgi:hypothetical protein